MEKNACTDVDYKYSYHIDNPNPLVTVLINNYNYARYLSAAIDSVLSQTWQHLEIIVVDDGSTDDSRTVLEQYQDNVRVILKENGGQASAFNAGIKEAQGDIICFLDSDDYWRPDKVERVVAKYHEAPWGLVCHQIYEVDINGDRLEENACVYKHFTLHSGDLLSVISNEGVKWMFSPTSGMSLPTEIARKIIPIPEADWRICADSPLAYAAICHAPVGVINQPLTAYRLHNQNGFSVMMSDKRDIRIHSLIAKAKNYLFICDYLKRIGLSIELKNPKFFYRYARDLCFIAKEKPWQALFFLWKLNIHENFNVCTDNKQKRFAAIKYLCLDALLAILMFLRLPTPYQTFRQLFKQKFLNTNPRVKAYLLDI